jgi:uncharacterized protein YggE
MSKAGIVLGSVGLALVALVLVLQLANVVPGIARADGVAEPTGITVLGQGKASGSPDLAMITLGVESREREAQEAAEQNKVQMAAVMAALRDMGIAEEDIQTVDYSIHAEIDWESEEHRVIGYVLVNSVLVKMREMEKVADVLDAATEAGANTVYGIQFTFDDPSPLREQARSEAMAEARMKADALAQLAGVGLGRPRYVSESLVEFPPFEPMYAAPVGMGGGDATSVSPGQLEVTVQVQVTYEIN